MVSEMSNLTNHGLNKVDNSQTMPSLAHGHIKRATQKAWIEWPLISRLQMVY